MAQTKTANLEPEQAAPTSYTIRSRESIERSWLFWTFTVIVVPIVVAVAIDWSVSSGKLQYSYEAYNDGKLAATGVLAVVVVVALVALLYLTHRLYSTRNQTIDVELSAIICPLGIQRSRTTTTTYNHDSNRQKINEHYYPLVPIEAVKDCILLEHVGGFSVTTHVMIRLKANTESKNTVERTDSTKVPEKKEVAASGLLEMFPDANLTFVQCHGLVKQIGRALKDMQT